MIKRSRFWSWTAEILSLEEIEPRPMKNLFCYWNDMARGGVPDQRKLQISEMSDCIGNIALVMLRKNPMRGRYRIVGRNLVSLLGSDPTGQYIHEVYSSSISDEVYDSFTKAIEGRKAVYFRREYMILGKSFGYHRLVLPMCLKTEEIDRLLICIYPTNNKLTSAGQWKPLVNELNKVEEAERRFASVWADSQDLQLEEDGG